MGFHPQIARMAQILSGTNVVNTCAETAYGEGPQITQMAQMRFCRNFVNESAETAEVMERLIGPGSQEPNNRRPPDAVRR
jgi:hypothetical protein